MSFQLVMDSGSRCMYWVRAASDKELTNCCSSHASSQPHCAMKCAMCSYGSPTTGELGKGEGGRKGVFLKCNKTTLFFRGIF
jgi:hypothetical protein